MGSKYSVSKEDSGWFVKTPLMAVGPFTTEREAILVCDSAREEENLLASAIEEAVESPDKDLYLELPKTATEKLEDMGLKIKSTDYFPEMENPYKQFPAPELSPFRSDGGSSSYYIFKMPIYRGAPKYSGGQGYLGWAETEDVIKYMVDNDFDLGNILKSSRRIASNRSGAGKEGTDELYDWKKIKHTAEKNIRRIEEEV